MIGVTQASRMLQFVYVITQKGAVEQVDRRTRQSRCYTNPFNKSGLGAPYVFVSKKGAVKFGVTFSTAAMMDDDRVSRIINGGVK
jgi:hypothetical protein